MCLSIMMGMSFFVAVIVARKTNGEFCIKYFNYIEFSYNCYMC